MELVEPGFINVEQGLNALLLSTDEGWSATSVYIGQDPFPATIFDRTRRGITYVIRQDWRWLWL